MSFMRLGPSRDAVAMAEGDPGHQFQMLLKPLERALRHEDVEAALRLAGNLFEIGDRPSEFEDRKVHVLMRAMEGASPSVKTAFSDRLLERFGPDLSEDARLRIGGLLDRL